MEKPLLLGAVPCVSSRRYTIALPEQRWLRTPSLPYQRLGDDDVGRRYPSTCSTAFSVFICRDIGQGVDDATPVFV